MNNRFIETEILIIGSGIAGLTAAIFGAEAGFKVLVLNRAPNFEESNTKYAQGGIIYRGRGDCAEILVQDINLAGDGVGNLHNIRILAKEGPELVENFLIKKIKVPFSKDSSGNFHLTKEAAHSRKRILHVADATGKFIEHYLAKEIKKYSQIEVLTNHTAVDLLTLSKSPAVIGAYVLDRNSTKIKVILSQRTILATGGAGQIFLYTTNPEGARGDGIAMAQMAGAKIVNLEYIQFHPTCFVSEDQQCFLISEAVRGEGAKLLNRFRKPFMKKYDPRAELAPRDKVSRAIWQEMKETRSKCVFLDLAPIKKKGIKIKERFPTIYKHCLKFGINIEKGLIPVVPAAHYLCGGVWADSWGKTTLKNLYAIGEVACTRLHGANRLAGTALLEGLVWGARCIRDIKKHYKAKDILKKFKIPAKVKKESGEEIDQTVILRNWKNIRTIMWNHVGIVRTKKGLEKAKKDLSSLNKDIEKLYRKTKLSDNLIGLRNGVRVAHLIAEEALRNKRSRGCHYRVD